ncbi:unnamed protein product [Ceutorhynchus assimilis]|uniref:Methyltransferase domain-containing protein n=1 Tax=Ceutorhynchus assimilis TaxID=467358 RepID=A0A9N9N033_9CUCU|nr:unnamed protein product [Ceutorhynchus assimilis]
MNLLPKSKDEFSQKEYWDDFFKKRGSKAFEWYGEYPELCGNLHKYLKKQDEILIVGCGNSTLGKDLYDVGCSNITNIDISHVVIKQMQSQIDKNRPNLKYLQMDALNTTFSNEQFSAVVDKGTLDALMPDNSKETLEKIDKYFAELQRILRPSGRYVCISLLQEHILSKLLDYFPQNNWMFRVVRCFESEAKSIENGENPMPVFMVICTKFKSLPMKVLEVNLFAQDKMQRCQTTEEVTQHISTTQRASFVCNALKKSTIGAQDEIEMEVFDPKNPNTPRYSIYVVEIDSEVKNAAYAALIVPEGREAEWLFSTKAGRKNLIEITKLNRLTIVIMHRGQKYESLELVEKELEEIVCNLAPANLTARKIPFLTVGSAELGKRTIKHEGTSPFSGNYIIEDVEHNDDNLKYRRLYYLSSQLVIQSEAKLKTIRQRSGTKKEVVDLTVLTCQHHVYMSIAAHAAVNKNSKVVVLGLGGGGLCSFLHNFLPQTDIVGVEIDPEMLKIATKWFGFQPNSKLQAKIQDGLEFIRQLDSDGLTVDAILCDVDSKSTEIGMSCPPKEFLASDFLGSISKVIGKRGLFVANIVLRDQTLRPGILATLQDVFKMVVAYKLSKDLNEIFVCTNFDGKKEEFLDKLGASAEAFKRFSKDEIDVVEYLRDLKINS